MNFSDTIKELIIETVRNIDDPYIKRTDSLHGNDYKNFNSRREVIAIPGYCVRLSEMIEAWGDRRGRNVSISSTYGNVLYAVDVPDGLWNLPEFCDDIVGYVGAPKLEISQDILKEIWNKPISIAIGAAEAYTGHYWREDHDFMHDAMRSIKPGVNNISRDGSKAGYKTEIIINVPCKMKMLSVPDDADGNINISHNLLKKLQDTSEYIRRI